MTGRKGGRTWERPILGIWMFSVEFRSGHQCDTPGNLCLGMATLRMKSGADLAVERIVKLGRAQAASLVDRLVSGPHRVWGNLCILGTLFQ